MFSKLQIFSVAFLCVFTKQLNGQDVKPNKISPRLIVNEYYYTGDFDGKTRHDYQGLRVFIINYSDDTLKYWGTKSRFRDFFTVTGSNDLRLINEEDNGNSFEKMIIPPHRSQRISLRLAVDKAPYGVVELKVSLKFYKWFKTDHFEEDRKHQQADILSDKIIIRYNKDGGAYSSRADWAEKERKESLKLPTTELYLLTATDRKYYSLTVDAGKILKGDKVAYPYDKDVIILVPVTVYNNSADTLKYYSMTCSWQDFYHVDNKLFSIVFSGCDKNIPKLIIVPPHSSKSTIVPVAYKQNNTKGIEAFRIGLNLNIWLSKNKSAYDPFNFNFEELTKYNLIWSNEVELKTQ